MNIGDYLVINGRAYELLCTTTYGDILVKDVCTDQKLWLDYFANQISNPHEDGGALLQALGNLKPRPPAIPPHNDELSLTDVL